MRRQKIRHLLLLLLRCVAIALLVAAFARPFFERRTRPISGTGAREVVILLDRSSSMGYADRWTKARDAAKKAVSGLIGDRSRDARRSSPATRRSRASRWRRPIAIIAAINATKLSSEGTRYAPALKLASQIIAASTLPRREVVLISDFQKVGWANHNEIIFPQGTVVTPVDLGGPAAADVAVSQVTTNRDSTGERDHVTVAARLDQHGRRAEDRVARRSPIGGRDAQTKQVTVAGARRAAGRVHVDRRAEWRDEGRGPHHAGFVDAGRRPQLHDRAGRSRAGAHRRAGERRAPNQSLFLSRALAIGDRPSFRVDREERRRADAARFRRTRARRARRSRLRRTAQSARGFAR